MSKRNLYFETEGVLSNAHPKVIKIATICTCKLASLLGKCPLRAAPMPQVTLPYQFEPNVTTIWGFVP